MGFGFFILEEENKMFQEQLVDSDQVVSNPNNAFQNNVRL
jgi:hypothetical protein